MRDIEVGPRRQFGSVAVSSVGPSRDVQPLLVLGALGRTGHESFSHHHLGYERVEFVCPCRLQYLGQLRASAIQARLGVLPFDGVGVTALSRMLDCEQEPCFSLAHVHRIEDVSFGHIAQEARRLSEQGHFRVQHLRVVRLDDGHLPQVVSLGWDAHARHAAFVVRRMPDADDGTEGGWQRRRATHGRLHVIHATDGFFALLADVVGDDEGRAEFTANLAGDTDELVDDGGRVFLAMHDRVQGVDDDQTQVWQFP